MSKIAYYRVSSKDQSVESQRHAMGGGPFEREFIDHNVSGGTLAMERPKFKAAMNFIREGDTFYVYAVDRLGRDAIDIQVNVRTLMEKGVAVYIHSLGMIGKGVGEMIVALLAQVAQMERNRIHERTTAGREVARKFLAETGKTHHGKPSLGRPLGKSRAGEPAVDPDEVAQWRLEEGRSIAVTAEHFKVSPASVKRYCASFAERHAAP